MSANLAELAKGFSGERSRRSYICPGVDGAWARQRLTNSWDSIDDWSDYAYVYYSNLLWSSAVENKYPLMYDKRLANHAGNGINILLTDGHVIWDKDANWLKTFASEHPEFTIPLPSDCNKD